MMVGYPAAMPLPHSREEADEQPPEARRYVDRYWPLSARTGKSPAMPPSSALAVAPDLAEVLRTVPDPHHPKPSRSDWPANAARVELTIPGLFNAVEWSDADTEHVRACITNDLDAFMRALIDRWRGLWWQLTWESKFQVRFPAFIAALTRRRDGDPRHAREGEAHRAMWLERACTVGLWDVYRHRHPWPDYTAQNCVVCGRRFAPEALWAFELSFGPPIACKSCCRRALFGHELTTVDVRGLVKSMADLLGFPPAAAFRAQRDVFALSAHRAELMALLVALPEAAVCSEALGIPKGSGRWLSVLQQSGVVGEAWKMSRGVMTLAADGHLCRSFGELAVEKYLIAQGIEHQCEPTYPAHAELNPNGKQRADWLLPGDLWVEYAGMMSENEYATKMAEKIKLAAAVGIDLLVLTPDDLPRLAHAFAGVQTAPIPPGVQTRPSKSSSAPRRSSPKSFLPLKAEIFDALSPALKKAGWERTRNRLNLPSGDSTQFYCSIEVRSRWTEVWIEAEMNEENYDGWLDSHRDELERLSPAPLDDFGAGEEPQSWRPKRLIWRAYGGKADDVDWQQRGREIAEATAALRSVLADFLVFREANPEVPEEKEDWVDDPAAYLADLWDSHRVFEEASPEVAEQEVDAGAFLASLRGSVSQVNLPTDS